MIFSISFIITLTNNQSFLLDQINEQLIEVINIMIKNQIIVWIGLKALLISLRAYTFLMLMFCIHNKF